LELEMLDVPAEAEGTLADLMNAVASHLMEGTPGRADEPFAIGQGIDLVWLPWEEAIGKVDQRLVGTRADRDDVHSLPAAVLFAPGRGLFGRRYQSAARYMKRLSENPLIFLTAAETERMARLAAERWEAFRLLFERQSGVEGWAFLVKLGYAVDTAETGEREHLWFELHDIAEDDVEATLLNQPYGIARLQEGDRGRHPLALLSDWTIFSPRGRFTPDTLPFLLAAEG
jgi:hypothetical protein